MRKVYFNGNFVDESEAKISIFDSALMFGDMVFEMTRSFNKKQFKLKEHIDRLYMGIKILRIPIDMTPKEMEEACYKTIEINDPYFDEHDEHRLMIDVSRGLLGIYHNIDNLHKGSNVIIADFPLKWTVRGMGGLFKKGINAVITSQRAIPGYLLDPKIKNRSRLHYLMANIEASQFTGDDNWALMLDPDGYVAEGTGDNFFIIKNGTILTPKGKNILRGISRDYVLNQLSSDLGIPAYESDIEAYDIYNCDEAFMTGTPFCMLPVVSINGLPIGDGKVGKVFSKILQQWSNNINVNISEQIQTWDQENNQEKNNSPTPYSFKKNK